MNTFRAKVLCTRLRNLTALKDMFHHFAGKAPSATLLSATASFDLELKAGIALCESLGFSDAGKTLTRVLRTVETGQLDASRLTGEAMHAHNALMDDIDKLKYVYIPRDRCRFVNQDRLFGDKVWVFFKDARGDLRDAGNCIAIGAGTAAVFHLMRAAEHGLRALGKKLRVSVKFKEQPQPIEYVDWNDVITAVRNQITVARGLTSKREKQRRLDFYSDAADQSEYIKDIWRNTISHARRGYNVNEAIGVLQRVEGYMVRLAGELPSVKMANVSPSGASKPSHVRRFPSSALKTP